MVLVVGVISFGRHKNSFVIEPSRSEEEGKVGSEMIVGFEEQVVGREPQPFPTAFPQECAAEFPEDAPWTIKKAKIAKDLCEDPEPQKIEGEKEKAYREKYKEFLGDDRATAVFYKSAQLDNLWKEIGIDNKFGGVPGLPDNANKGVPFQDVLTQCFVPNSGEIVLIKGGGVRDMFAEGDKTIAGKKHILPKDIDLTWNRQTGEVIKCINEKWPAKDGGQCIQQYVTVVDKIQIGCCQETPIPKDKLPKWAGENDIMYDKCTAPDGYRPYDGQVVGDSQHGGFEPLEGIPVYGIKDPLTNQPINNPCKQENDINALMYDPIEKILVDPLGTAVSNLCHDGKFELSNACKNLRAQNGAKATVAAGAQKWVSINRWITPLRYLKLLQKGFTPSEHDVESDISFLADALISVEDGDADDSGYEFKSWIKSVFKFMKKLAKDWGCDKWNDVLQGIKALECSARHMSGINPKQKAVFIRVKDAIQYVIDETKKIFMRDYKKATLCEIPRSRREKVMDDVAAVIIFGYHPLTGYCGPTAGKIKGKIISTGCPTLVNDCNVCKKTISKTKRKSGQQYDPWAGCQWIAILGRCLPPNHPQAKPYIVYDDELEETMNRAVLAEPRYEEPHPF